MTRAARVMAVAAVVASVGLHVLALSIGERPEAAMIASAQATGLAKLGNSFTDLAAGTLTPVTPVVAPPEPAPTPVTPAPTPETAEPQPPVAADPVAPAPVAAVVVDPTASAPVAVTLPEPAPPVQAVAPLTATPSAMAVAPTAPVTATLPPLQEMTLAVSVAVTPPSPPDATQPVDPVESVAATDPVTMVLRALRPPERPVDLAPPPPPAPEREPAQVAVAPPPPPPASPGNADQDSVSGSDQATPQGEAVASGAGDAPQQAQDGNAEASNYPGLVMRQLSRVRRDRLNDRGSAVVAFTVDGNGGLAGLNIARSSGNPNIDQAGLMLVQRAAPFPAPPEGAQRSFSFEFTAG